MQHLLTSHPAPLMYAHLRRTCNCAASHLGSLRMTTAAECETAREKARLLPSLAQVQAALEGHVHAAHSIPQARIYK